jgi:FKBP-type peptidyl-prolyl cis-trans isomerase (trigger factor)
VRDWRYLPFKAPTRKKYQDIDKQATLFIDQERAAKKTYAQSTITSGDWVLFEITLLNQKQKPLISDLSELLWIQISNEESGESFQSLFVGKKSGDSFITNHLCFQEYFGSSLDVIYLFRITIKEVLSLAYFCFDLFKEHFKLKSERKTHQKIVEVYSFRNDVSLRRMLVEEALALLTKTYPFDVPATALLRQEKIIRDYLQNNKDYTVYKLQHDFERNIHLLAQKQIHEQMIVDYFAHQENIGATDDDICQYLNLTKRPRTKEFIYFMHPDLRAREEDTPLQNEVLRHYCRKEKAINHILYHWSKP